MGENQTILNNKITSKEIDAYEFFKNEDLTEIIIPEGVKKIGERAFSGCKNIKRIILPQSLTYIGNSAFSECENLEEITVPSNLKKLNYRTFADCRRLKKIIIEEGIEELEWAVFAGCENLEEIILPQSIKKLDKQLFLNCKKLKNVTLPNNIEELPDEFFKGCFSLDITLNENIKKLGTRTFEKCYSLKTFPKDVIDFGENCFKECKNLTKATINSKTKTLPDGMFDGCIKLEKINYEGNKNLNIGKRCFRNCKSITSIPSFIDNFNERAFENCDGITSIDIIDTTIPFACFRGCTNLKQINNQEKIISIKSFAFSGCINLEEINILYPNVISAEAFSNCKKLKKVILNQGVKQIGSRAFYNCNSLSNINLPESLITVKKEAFKNCHSIKKITIPSSLKSFGDAAFSYMDSLETIDVSPRNKNFITPDHKILIMQMQEKLVLYASGCKDKSYTLKDYVIETDMFSHSLIKPLTGIGEYAFAGAKNLEELSVCACTQNIEATAFYGCDNLKTLNIEAISLFTCPGFHTREHGRYYFKGHSKTKAYMPFETVNFTGDLVQIFPNALENFTNVKTLNLPTEYTYSIGINAFSDCTLLEEVKIPKQVNNISKDSFSFNTKLIFENGIQTKELGSLILENKHIGEHKLYTLKDGTYYIEQNDKIIKLTKKQMDEICSHSEEIHDDPALFLDFTNDLCNRDLDIKIFYNGILMSKISEDNRKILFQNIKKDDKFSLNVLKHSEILDDKNIFTKHLLIDDNFKKVIDFIKILKKHNITEPLLYNKRFMCCSDITKFEKLITHNLSLLIKIIKDSELLKSSVNEGDIIAFYKNDITGYILMENTIYDFIKYVEKYNIKDQYLIDKIFISIAKNPLADDFFKAFDTNLKRLLKLSEIKDNISSAKENMNDLLNLLKITGALEENLITRQRASTFISEKIFAEYLPNDDINEFRIVGDNIHRIFNFTNADIKYNKEFATFFLENYKEIYNHEKMHSGFIERVYKNFDGISKTCTSNKGSQRKLKVTLEKCRNYLLANKFDNVNEENNTLALLIGCWYDKNETWNNALMIYKESLKAPRNIFTKVTFDEDGNIIYDNNKKHDLKEPLNDNFSYEWLPKQDYNNLVLGKYCNCCAHIEGAGQGIMRASMILDNCQNLVIKNSTGEIIAKSTLYVNKKEGYAVFNNVESSINYRENEDLENIYNAFIRGINAFVNIYNKNNITPITIVTIGSNRNTILKYLNNKEHPEVEILNSISYGEYSINNWTSYNGDWASGQRLVLKR